jgi:hypothetical protein
MGNFGMAVIKGEGQAVSFDDYDYEWQAIPYVVHMKAKGRWQVLTWSKQSRKYKVVSEHPTERQARAIRILMEK